MLEMAKFDSGHHLARCIGRPGSLLQSQRGFTEGAAKDSCPRFSPRAEGRSPARCQAPPGERRYSNLPPLGTRQPQNLLVAARQLTRQQIARLYSDSRGCGTAVAIVDRVGKSVD